MWFFVEWMIHDRATTSPHGRITEYMTSVVGVR